MSAQAYFILQFSTLTGRRQSVRFHTQDPIDLALMPERLKNAFILDVLRSNGFELVDLNPSSPIALLSFTDEGACKEHYDEIATAPGNVEGVAPKSIFSLGRRTGKTKTQI